MADRSATRTGQLMAGVRAMPLFTQLCPERTQVGWPIPVRRGAVYLRLPLCTFEPVAGRGSALFAPFATLTVDWATGRPVEYADLRYTRPWPPGTADTPVGMFPHPGVRASLAGYQADRERLLAGYDGVVGALAGGPAYGDPAGFGSLLRRLLEPDLEPYYRALGPKFFDRFLGPGRSAADPAT